jgi:hypothetical protein
MSLLLLENAWGQHGATIPDGGGRITGGTYTCSSGKGTLQFDCSNGPAYSASNLMIGQAYGGSPAAAILLPRKLLGVGGCGRIGVSPVGDGGVFG